MTSMMKHTWWAAPCLALCLVVGSAPVRAQGPGQRTATTHVSGRKPADATARCTDGTYSTSTTAEGTCAAHNGVAKWYAKARCGDGTLSMTKSRKGACTGHQGVAEWLKKPKASKGT